MTAVNHAFEELLEHGTWSDGTFVHLDPPAIPGYVTGPHQSTDFAAVPQFLHACAVRGAGLLRRHEDDVPHLRERAVIAEKGSCPRNNNLGGVIIWTISQGYLEWKTTGERDPLMKAIVKAFR